MFERRDRTACRAVWGARERVEGCFGRAEQTEETTSIPLPAHARTAHVHVTRMVVVWRTAHNGGNNTAWRELWVGRRLVEDRSTVVHELDDHLVLRRRRGDRPRKIRRLRR